MKKVAKRYFIELSHRDIARVSYFPGTEARDNPDADWIGAAMMPAALALAKRKAAAIREVPITFWITVRPTARRKAEIFIFATPGRPLARVQQAVEGVLKPFEGGNVSAGLEPIPCEAVPFCQVFRGMVLRLYTMTETDPGRRLPLVVRRDGGPKVLFGRIEDDNVNEVSGDGRQMLVEARCDDESTGEYLRKFQQALNVIAREDK
jgi:hypothetical protein